jgi:hypothetical protein
MTRPLAALLLSTATLVLAGAARADRLVMKDGRVIEGVVAKDGAAYRVASRFGEALVPEGDVATWEKGPTLDAQWRERVASLEPGDHGGRAEVARWLKDQGLGEEATALATRVVSDDPENAVAHEVLGHVRHRGAWMSPDEAKRADGLVEHGGRWYTPAEWDLLDAEARGRAEAAGRRLEGERVAARVNDAARLMLAPDPELRAEGKRRLESIATETKNDAFLSLVPKLEAYAAATDRLVAAAGGGGQGGGGAASADVLAECRIQLVKLKRPIKVFETTLASNLSAAPVRIQLPEVEVIKVGTTVKLPGVVR